MDVGPGGDGAEGLGVGAAVWAGLSLLIALFIGGMVATRTSPSVDRGGAALQGTLVWVLATLSLIYLAASGVSLGVGTLFGALGSVTGGIGAMVGSGAAGLGALGSGDVDQILARLDDPRTADMVAAATGMSADEARTTLADIRIRVEAARNDPARAAAEARQGLQTIVARAGEQATRAAATAQTYATRTSWIALGAMVLSLLAAVGGAMVGHGRTASWTRAR